MRRCLPVTLLLLPLLSCDPADGDGRWAGTIDTLPGGAVRVRNPATPSWRPEAAWEVVEELRLGAVDAEGPAQFGEIRAVVVDPEDRIYVLDGHAQEVRVFDREGAHVRSFGRPGAGPGELRRAMTMLFDPQGHLRVLDPQNNRISVFDTAGRYVKGLWMAGSFFTTRWPGGYDDRGFFYSFLPDFSEAFRFVLVRFDSALTALDTIPIPAYDGETFDYTSPDGNNSLRTGVPFAPFLVWLFEPGRAVWAGVNDAYRIVVRGLDGDTLRVIERAYEPVAVSAADRDSALVDLEWFMKEGGTIDASRIPAGKPAFQGFYRDQVGNLWVLPFTRSELQGRVADVFDAEGRYLGEVELPFTLGRQAPWPVITDRHFYAVTEDDLGVQYVVRARIEKGS